MEGHDHVLSARQSRVASDPSKTKCYKPRVSIHMSFTDNRFLSLTSSFASQCTNLAKLHCRRTPSSSFLSVENGSISASEISSLQTDSTMNINPPVATLTDGQAISNMVETMPVKIGTDTDSKFTRNTKVWWQDKTGWTDDEYAYRRNAVYNKIRERWPEEKSLNGRDGNGALVKQEIRDWLRPLIISFNDQNWPPGATRDRVERQLQPYISWALYLNRHPPTLNMPTIATSTHAANMVSQVKTTPTLPSYSFVTPSQLTTSDSRSIDPMNTIQGDYWSQTSSDEDEPAPIKTPYQSRKSQSVVTQSPSTIGFDWDDIEVVIDASCIKQDHIWIPMYDLKPAPKHSPAHWADFRMMNFFRKVSSELNIEIDQENYQFVYQNQPGNFTFRREGAYHIALKRFSQMSPADQVLRLRLERVSAHGGFAITSLRTGTGHQIPVQTPHRPSALTKRPSEVNQPGAKQIITSDVHLNGVNGGQTSIGTNKPHEWGAQRPRKRTKFTTENAEPSPSFSGETTSSDTPPSGNSFAAVNFPAAVDTIAPARSPVEESPSIPAQPQQEEDARNVMFSGSDISDQDMTRSDDIERTPSDTITLIKMEGLR